MAKPDNRKNNSEKIQRSIDNTIENRHEAKDFLAAHKGEIPAKQAESIRDKNANRREAVDGFRKEIKDEAQFKRNH